MSRILQHNTGVLLQCLHVSLAGRPVQHPCLAESAAADTSPLDFQHNPVLRCFDKGHHRLHRIRRFRHIHYNLLFHRGRNPGLRRCKGLQRTILMIICYIEHRSIDTLNPCRLSQKLCTAAVPGSAGLVEIQQFIIDRLSLSYIKQIKELCQRFRIVGAGAAADYNRMIPGAFRTVKRNLA